MAREILDDWKNEAKSDEEGRIGKQDKNGAYTGNNSVEALLKDKNILAQNSIRKLRVILLDSFLFKFMGLIDINIDP